MYASVTSTRLKVMSKIDSNMKVASAHKIPFEGHQIHLSRFATFNTTLQVIKKKFPACACFLFIRYHNPLICTQKNFLVQFPSFTTQQVNYTCTLLSMSGSH